MPVVLYSFALEIASTINASPHGVQILTKTFWAPIMMFPFDRSPAVSIRARTSFIAHRFQTFLFCRVEADSTNSELAGTQLAIPLACPD